LLTRAQAATAYSDIEAARKARMASRTPPSAIKGLGLLTSKGSGREPPPALDPREDGAIGGSVTPTGDAGTGAGTGVGDDSGGDAFDRDAIERLSARWPSDASSFMPVKKTLDTERFGLPGMLSSSSLLAMPNFCDATSS